MPGQLGRSLLLKLGDGASPEVFTTVAGLQDTTIALNDVAVDVTSKDSAGIRQLLAGKILQSMIVSASGVSEDSAIMNTLRDVAQAGTHSNYQLVIPGTPSAGGTYEGAFRITAVEESAAYCHRAAATARRSPDLRHAPSFVAPGRFVTPAMVLSASFGSEITLQS